MNVKKIIVRCRMRAGVCVLFPSVLMTAGRRGLWNQEAFLVFELQEATALSFSLILFPVRFDSSSYFFVSSSSFLTHSYIHFRCADFLGWAIPVTLRNNDRCFVVHPCRTEQLRNSFFCRTVVEWNHLDNNIVHSASVNSFRTAIS